MKKYLYIVAFYPPELPGDDPDESFLSFAKAFITADDEGNAYNKGQRMVENAEIEIIPESELVNDWVVELPHRLEA